MFRLATTIAAVLCAGLFAFLLVAPGPFADLYGASADAGAAFMGRRTAPVFLGLSVMFWTLRDASAFAFRPQLALGMATVFGGVALTGVWAWFDGSAGLIVLPSAVAEGALSALFVAASRRG